MSSEVEIPKELTVTVIAPRLEAVDLAKLAMEITLGFQPLPEILAHFGLTNEQYTQYIALNSYFKQALEAAAKEWNNIPSTKARVAIRAAYLAELHLQTLHDRMGDDKNSLTSVVEAFRTLMKAAGIGEENERGVSGEKITINIDLGDRRTPDGKKNLVIESGASPIQYEPERESAQSAIPPLLEGPPTDTTLQPQSAPSGDRETI